MTKLENKTQEMQQLIDIGHSLTSEKDFNLLMEKIMLGAKNLSNADGGTIYLLTDDEKRLRFEVVQTDSLNIKMGGSQGKITWPELSLYLENGDKNDQMVAVLCALNGELINISDVYEAEGFNFEGTRNFDKSTGYRTKSMLVVPMKDHEENVIGVLQLLNKNNKSGEVITFTQDDEKLIASMASQAAISITNTKLIKGLEELLDAFIRSIAAAIGEKSPYTGGHIDRVAEIAETLIEAINEDKSTYKKQSFSQSDIRQMSIAAWLHDIGKIVTPEYVVDKGCKLETIYDRIEIVEARFEVLKKEIENEYLKKCIKEKNQNKIEALKKEVEIQIQNLEDDFEFIKTCNTGGEFMEDEKIEKLHEIGKRRVIVNKQEIALLSENELYNLSIKKGTLTDEEREVINNHVIVSYKMLQSLPFPKKMKRIPIIAGSHHKKVKGGGYAAAEILELPMTLEDKILAVADVFEALTSSDRPYKKANSLNTSLRILSFMVKDGDLDKDLVKFFVKNNLHLEYAKKHLNEEQIDEITVDFDSL